MHWKVRTTTLPLHFSLTSNDIRRHFALSELKILMIVLLTYATIEVDPLSSQRPSFDWGRFGFGMLSAKGDMRVIIKKRKTA